MKKIPSLLLPAGSPECFDAALAAGADEIYIGGKTFNARLGAENFDNEQLVESIKKAHFFGVKVNVTLNTLILDREFTDALHFAEFLYEAGADALIITDPGLIEAVRTSCPGFRLHASTQCSAHNADAVKLLAARGCSRVVLARECSRDNIKKIRELTPDVELEVFAHGALCVCHSGMCEFSAYMGGRSGNRGECAQPCRLPDCDGVYRFSLKDNCLAGHMTELIDAGVDTLKIEGRMKSPEYVYGVGRIYRRLLDERRNATTEELRELEEIFSRGGFTDGYFTGKIGQGMLGVRSDADKEKTKAKEAELAAELAANRRRIPVSVCADIRAGKISVLTLSCSGGSVTVYGDIPQPAVTSPLTEADVVKNLCKFGNTPFSVDISSFSLCLDKGISLPISAINSLRRTAAKRLEDMLRENERPARRALGYIGQSAPSNPAGGCDMSAHFTRSKGMPDRQYLSKFTHVFLPIDEYLDSPTQIRDMTDGVDLPPVVMQNEISLLEEMLIRAKLCGIKHVTVSNIGSLRTAAKYGFQLHGGLLLNVYNSHTARELAKEGLSTLTLSPELNIVQMKSIAGVSPVRVGAAVYGKLPATVLEKCVIRDAANEKVPLGKCDACGDGEFRYIRDRAGERVPVCRQFIHRNMTFNPYPVYMADKLDSVFGGAVGDLHWFFTDETPEEAVRIMEAYEKKEPAAGKIRRM